MASTKDGGGGGKGKGKVVVGGNKLHPPWESYEDDALFMSIVAQDPDCAKSAADIKWEEVEKNLTRRNVEGCKKRWAKLKDSLGRPFDDAEDEKILKYSRRLTANMVAVLRKFKLRTLIDLKDRLSVLLESKKGGADLKSKNEEEGGADLKSKDEEEGGADLKSKENEAGTSSNAPNPKDLVAEIMIKVTLALDNLNEIKVDVAALLATL